MEDNNFVQVSVRIPEEEFLVLKQFVEERCGEIKIV